MKEEFLTLDEVAKKLRVNKMTVYRMAQKGKIPAFKFGKKWRVNTKKLEDMFEKGIKK